MDQPWTKARCCLTRHIYSSFAQQSCHRRQRTYWRQGSRCFSAKNSISPKQQEPQQPVQKTTKSAIPLHWLDLSNQRLSILERLLLEECLLRNDTTRNWMIVGCHAPSHGNSTHYPDAAIVMGIGGKASDLLHVTNVKRDNVLTIRRFSGGGTVVMDSDAIWTTLIGRPIYCEPIVPSYPRPLMEYTATAIYNPLFRRMGSFQQNKSKFNSKQVPSFSLREHDYVLNLNYKIGGNAQSISGATGWLHHTSFLWDYRDCHMRDYLRLPAKRPEYRADRDHGDFLVRLSQLYDQLEKKDFVSLLQQVCVDEYDLQVTTFLEAMAIVNQFTDGQGLQGWQDTKSRTRLVDLDDV